MMTVYAESDKRTNNRQNNFLMLIENSQNYQSRFVKGVIHLSIYPINYKIKCE